MMRHALAPLVILLLASCAGANQPQTSATATATTTATTTATATATTTATTTAATTSASGFYSSSAGPVPVGAIPNAVLHDAQRNKDVGMVIEYPTRGGPHPIIIFSHGYGGSKNGYVA